MGSEKDIFEAFGTIVSITAYGDIEAVKHAMTCVRTLCAEYENLFSRTIPGSDVWKVNESEGKYVELDPRTVSLLKSALGYCEASEGMFDITVGALVSQWDFKSGVIADRACLEAIAQDVGWKSIQLGEGSSARIANAGCKIDLGGIAKGWIADALHKVLGSLPITGYVIDLGGNIIVGGQRPDGVLWKVGVRDPQNPRSKSIASIEMEAGSVVTSGIYERCFVSDGKLYHHILDAHTGMPVETDLISATVVAEDSLTAEGFSTTLLALGLDRAKEFVRYRPEIKHALFITRDMELAFL